MTTPVLPTFPELTCVDLYGRTLGEHVWVMAQEADQPGGYMPDDLGALRALIPSGAAVGRVMRLVQLLHERQQTDPEQVAHLPYFEPGVFGPPQDGDHAWCGYTFRNDRGIAPAHPMGEVPMCYACYRVNVQEQQLLASPG